MTALELALTNVFRCAEVGPGATCLVLRDDDAAQLRSRAACNGATISRGSRRAFAHSLDDQDGADIVNIGERRAGDDQVPMRSNKPWLSWPASIAARSSPAARARASVSGRAARRRRPPCRRFRRCRRPTAQMPGAPSRAIARPSRKVGVAAAPCRLGRGHGHGRLAAGQQHGGRRAAAGRGADAAGDTGHDDAHLRGLALQRVAQDQRRQPQAARGLGRHGVAAPSSAWRSCGIRRSSGCRVSAFRRRPAPGGRRRLAAG